MHLLIVEDDDAIAAPLARGLEREGFGVTRVTTGAAALRAEGHDLVLLDLGMPDMDGFTICRELRSRSEVPIIVVTARGDETDRVVGLQLGADDYLVKPFGFRELVARIGAVTRRAAPRPPEEADARTIGALVVDARRHRITLAGAELTLTPKEFDLLHHLMGAPGQVFSRDQLLDAVWDAEFFGYPSTVTVHVRRLREKVERDPERPTHIKTVWGLGYKFDPSA